MQADYTTYRTAETRAVFGILVQSAAAVALLLYAAYSGRDHASAMASVFAASGVIVWLALILLYDLSRRERIEAMEAESLEAADAAAASAFEGTGDELRLARRRLEGFVRYALPAFGVAFGLVVVIAGVWGTLRGLEILAPAEDGTDTFKAIGGAYERLNPGAAIFVSTGIASVGFIVARFVSGMAKQPVWSNLRAGASMIVGAALMGVLMLVAYGLDFLGLTDAPLRWLAVVVPALMVLFGAETFLNLLLQAYSPRKPGEGPRTAFDLRSLGLIAAPDRVAASIGEALNYQFGVKISETWFYRLFVRWWHGLVLFGVVVAWGLTSVVIVQPHQRGALILANGEIAAEVEPGWRFKLPWPFGEALVPEHTFEDDGGRRVSVRTTTGIRTLELGTPRPTGLGAILWTKSHGVEERFSIVRPSVSEETVLDDRGSDDDAADVALVAVEVPLHYTIESPSSYVRLAAEGQTERLLTVVGRRAMERYLSGLTVDEVLATRRTALAGGLRGEIERAYRDDLSRLGLAEGPGIGIRFVGAEGVHPPQDTANMFEAVVEAQQAREALIESARRHEVTTLSAVAGSVSQARAIADLIDGLNEMETRLQRGVEAGPAREDLEHRIGESEREIERLLARAGGEAGEMLTSARADRWDRHMGERGRALLYEGQVAAYAANPRLYIAQGSYASLRRVLAGSRLYILSPEIREPRVRLEWQDDQSQGELFRQLAESEDR